MSWGTVVLVLVMQAAAVVRMRWFRTFRSRQEVPCRSLSVPEEPAGTRQDRTAAVPGSTERRSQARALVPKEGSLKQMERTMEASLVVQEVPHQQASERYDTVAVLEKLAAAVVQRAHMEQVKMEET